ncbi:MAG TPA: hypothetical protein VIT20_01300 [Propionibacteriaceae bacterium]
MIWFDLAYVNVVLLDIDPNVVKPGWTPLLITIGIAGAMVLLFFSMRRQFRKIDASGTLPTEAEVAAETSATPSTTPTKRSRRSAS